MAATDLFNQTITLYNRTSYASDGRLVASSGSNIKARVQFSNKQRYQYNGVGTGNVSVITIDLIAYISSNNTVNVDDRVSYDSTDYKIAGIYKTVDGAGNVNHIKLELVKWKV